MAVYDRGLLVGTLACSGKWRAALAEEEDRAHLIAGLGRVSRALGGLTRAWRFDRMATVCHPSSGKVTASFAAVAKHYGVQVVICPPYAGNRKGAVEKANHTAAQRVWRNVRDDMSIEAAQAKFDDGCRTKGDLRIRKRPEFPKDTIVELAKKEPVRPVPAEAFPAVTTVQRVVTSQALVAYAGSFYSVAPDHVRTTVVVHTRLGSGHIDITTTTVAPLVLARHRLEPAGAGAIVRTDTHITALSSAVLAATAGRRGPHNRKERLPPGPAAQAAAHTLRTTTGGETAETRSVVIDLATYAKAEAASALFHVISQRYPKSSTIITTNRGVESWGEILGDTTVAAAMLDRLPHRCVVLNLDGESYRLRTHNARNQHLRTALTR